MITFLINIKLCTFQEIKYLIKSYTVHTSSTLFRSISPYERECEFPLYK